MKNSNHSSPLSGKVALVTGSEQGIGRGLAVGLAQETAAEIRRAGSEAIIIRGNVSKPADCHKLIQAGVKKWGRLDAVINNAGRHFYKLLPDVTEKDWDTQLDTNVKGAFLLSQK